jgi:predicted secreted Zn-dependent protease
LAGEHEAAPGVRVTERRREYEVTGSTAGQLRDVIALLGPRRGGRTFVACTDWVVTWSYVRAEGPEGFRVGDATVDVEVTLVIPRWRPPRSAGADLIATWQDDLAALAAHEAGHRDLAIEAGCAIRAALDALGPAPSREALDEDARSRAAAILEEYRARERAYDEATGHGAG